MLTVTQTLRDFRDLSMRIHVQRYWTYGAPDGPT